MQKRDQQTAAAAAAEATPLSIRHNFSKPENENQANVLSHRKCIGLVWFGWYYTRLFVIGIYVRRCG